MTGLSHRWKAVLATFLLCSFYTATLLGVPNPITLSEIDESINIATHAEYFRDESGEVGLEEVRDRPFLPLTTDNIDFGFTPDKFWLRFEAVNASEQSIRKLLRTSARFMRPLEIYQEKADGTTIRLLCNDENQAFGDRPVPELRFLAVEFELGPLKRATFYMRFGAGGRAAMLVEVGSREQGLLEQYRAAVGIAVFVSVLMTLILVNFFHYLAVRHLAYLVYIVYESFNVLFVSHMDGFTFQYLWPNLPHWNDNATPIIAAIGLIVGNLFAMVFIETKKYTPLIHKLFLGLLALSFITLIITLVTNNRIGNQLVAPLLPLSLVLSVIAAFVALKKGHYVVRYFIVAWSLLAIGGVMWSGSMFRLFGISYGVLTIYKIIIAAQAIILSMGLADQVRRLNIQYIETQKSLIDNLQARLADARERTKLEKENEQATLALLEKSKQLATTSHDINQPIQSLRLTLKALATKSDAGKYTRQLENTLDHMEDVLRGTLDKASHELKSTNYLKINSIVVGKLINEIINLFDDQAKAKGLSLRGFPSEAVLVTRKAPLKRCLMNLVANALNNVEQGGILLGVRRRGNRLVFQVYDTGGGIPEKQIPLLLKPFAKDDHSTGYGLGLTIVSEICTEYDWIFNIQSKMHKGSCFSIAVPIRI